jgi:RNase P/RNase MRP subunit POP5
MHAGQAGEALNAITKRCSELFGSIAAEKAGIRLVKSNNTTIIKCKLDKLDNVLVAIALADPPAATLDMSGSMKQLQRRLAKI